MVCPMLWPTSRCIGVSDQNFVVINLILIFSRMGMELLGESGLRNLE